MGLVAKNSGGGDFEIAPAGNHIAVCYQVIDLGIQHGEYMGAPTSAHKVRIAWELSNELMSDGRPFSIGAIYTLSLSEKSNLRPLLESWRGRPFTEQELDGFDLKNILGAACMVNVIHKPNQSGQVRARVSSVSALPKGMQKPSITNAPLFYSIDDDKDGVIYARLDEWMQKMINRAPGQNMSSAHDERNPPGNDFEDDPIPF